jgi:glycosyltransferase involved in cell wall biosynthesis
MESLTWKFMEWFYGRMDVLWVNSESYRRTWAERGIAEEKLRILPRGIDTSLFQTNRRSTDFWQKRGARPGSVVLLYVGRISKEKNLDVIATAWDRIKRTDVTLAFVGDGPYLPELRERLPNAIFTGYLTGEPLGEAFASADVFLFPSTTDTFGNVIVEALASGLPCIVSDVGGPQDLIEHGQTGFVTRGLDASDFASATARLIDDTTLRETMRARCAASVAQRSWREAARRFLGPPPV